MSRRASPTRPRDAEAAREKCLRLLGLRARSAGELRDRLRSGGFPQATIRSVLRDLEAAKLIDDEEFARAWVASRQASGLAGREKLRWELRRKGLSQELIRQVVDEGIDDDTELRRAMALAQNRLRGQPAEAKTRARLVRLLLSRGFEHATVETALRRISQGTED